MKADTQQVSWGEWRGPWLTKSVTSLARKLPEIRFTTELTTLSKCYKQVNMILKEGMCESGMR